MDTRGGKTPDIENIEFMKQYAKEQLVLMAWNAGKVSDADAAEYTGFPVERLRKACDFAVDGGVKLVAFRKAARVVPVVAAFASN